MNGQSMQQQHHRAALAYRPNPYATNPPVWPWVVGGVVVTGVVVGAALWSRRATAKETTRYISSSRWDSGDLVPVKLDATYRTTVETHFSNPALGLVTGKLDDPDPEHTTIDVRSTSSKIQLGGGTLNEIEIYTGSTRGEATIMVGSGTPQVRELRLRIQ